MTALINLIEYSQYVERNGSKEGDQEAEKRQKEIIERL
jgi:hypothetical protein